MNATTEPPVRPVSIKGGHGRVLKVIKGPTRHTRMTTMIYSYWIDKRLSHREEYASPEKYFWEVACQVEEDFWGVRNKIFEFDTEGEAQKFLPGHEYSLDQFFRPA